MMISIYSEMIPYYFTVDWYDFYHTDIFHDFTAKNKIKFFSNFQEFDQNEDDMLQAAIQASLTNSWLLVFMDNSVIQDMCF